MTENTSQDTFPKTKNKTINLKEIQKQDKLLSKLSTHVLSYDYETNTNTVIKYYEKFSHDKITELLEEAYQAILDTEHDKEIDFFKGENASTDLEGYIIFLISVRFTSLDKDVPKGFYENYPIMLSMKNQGLIAKIIDEAMNHDQVFTVLDKLNELNDAMARIERIEEKSNKKLEKLEVKNKELFEQFKKYQDAQDNQLLHPLVNPRLQ